MKKIKYNEMGHCPLCGGTNITYGESYINDEFYTYKATCDDCATTFHEDYSLEFCGMSNVYDKDGNDYEWESVGVEE